MKKLKVVFIVIAIVLVWNHLPYYYNKEKAADYATNHAKSKSHCQCAWYVTKAMWHGGCPIGIVPAYAYEKTLPQMGFKEISPEGYKPMKGDISVLPQNSQSSFGHISIFDGKNWVSDFKHNTQYPNHTYRENRHEKIFRASDGWHWKHVWTSPADWYGWIEALVKGFHKIKI